MIPSFFLFFLFLLAPPKLYAHDADSYGGLYRSRDAGATWLPADAGLFINASNAIAIDSNDSNQLLYGADTRLMRSHNGGRDWHDQAPELIAGPIFCVAFDRDGKGAYAASSTGLFRGDASGQWHGLDVPMTALPIAQIVVANAKVYLAGNDGVYIGNADGQSWSGPANGLPEEPISALLVEEGAPGRNIHAVVAGRIWLSSDNGISWKPAAGNWTDQRIDTLSADLLDKRKLWAAGASRVFRSDDSGQSWQPHGQPLPDPNIFIRGIATMQGGNTVVLTTHRGLMRSADGGATWAKVEGALPLHLEPGPLAQDRSDPNIVYAGFSLRPYNEAWRAAQEAAQKQRDEAARKRYGAIAAIVAVIIIASVAAIFLRKRKSAPSPRPLGGEG